MRSLPIFPNNSSVPPPLKAAVIALACYLSPVSARLRGSAGGLVSCSRPSSAFIGSSPPLGLHRWHQSGSSPSPYTLNSPSHQSSTLSISTMTNNNDAAAADENKNDKITILGFGSLLSLKSSQVTFPTLENFRLGRVRNHRRVFSHPASIFFKRGIANLDTLEMSSLSVEYAEGHSFICSVFEVPNEGLSAVVSDGNQSGEWIPSQAFLEREEEFSIVMVPYEDILSSGNDEHDCDMMQSTAPPSRTETSFSEASSGAISSSNNDESRLSDVLDGNVAMTTDTSSTQQQQQQGIICRRSTDEAYLSQWGQAYFQKQYLDYGVKTIWGWGNDSGLRPCPVYLRHCVLASWNADGVGCDWSMDGKGGRCYNSFLDETFLVDRKTTIREYLKKYPEIMATEPPAELKERYGG